jgi:hypothetical protein
VAEAFTAEALAAAYGGRLAATHVDSWRWPGRACDALLDALLLAGRVQRRAGRHRRGAPRFAAGASGTFLFLRKRALVSDAMAHATLPGVGLAFIAWWRLAATGATWWAC